MQNPVHADAESQSSQGVLHFESLNVMPKPIITDIGPWSEKKIDIVRKYAKAYSAIMKNQQWVKAYAYIDGFAGAGKHKSRVTGQMVDGSPAAVLQVEPAFDEYHFVELRPDRSHALRDLEAHRPGSVNVYDGDANDKLLNEILPKFPYNSYRRALMLLDPYNIGIDWRITKRAGELRTIDLFLNFMVMDANMNVLHHDAKGVNPDQAGRMSIFWGDESWRDIMYQRPLDMLPGLDYDLSKKQSNDTLAQAFAERLRTVAGFKYVADPLAVKNDTGQTVYYLYFASHKEKALKIASAIFKNMRS